MNRLFRIVSVPAIFLSLLFACDKQDPQLPDNEITFESDQLGISPDEQEITITLNFSRSVAAATSINIQMTPTGVAYGTDFTTEPAATANVVTLEVAADATSAQFTLTKVDDALFDGDESIQFIVGTATSGLVPGGTAALTLSFAEILATSGSMELTGGGALFPNKVFVDLSGNRQTSVLRTTWDLAFSTTDDFRVILNTSNGTMVRQLNKTDLNTVTAADTLTFGSQMSIAAVFAAINAPSPPTWIADAINWIDDPTGNLSNTAIDQVASNPLDNKVYIINRGDGPSSPATQLGWKKFRVVRNGDNYTLQHADIGATSFAEIQITKDTALRFQYVHFTNGVVSVEPPLARWDIAWTGFTNTTNFGVVIPYYFQDIILQNIEGVQTAKILTSTVTYENFAEANLAGLTFSSSQIGIGADWRSGGGPGVAPFLRTDRFYIVKDADNNYYKLRFTALTTGGERGKPQLEFSLVKAGD